MSLEEAIETLRDEPTEYVLSAAWGGFSIVDYPLSPLEFAQLREFLATLRGGAQ